MGNYRWDFRPVLDSLPALGKGMWVSLQLSGLTVVIGTGVGLVVGILLCSKIRIVRYPLYFITDAVRSLPVLILILWVYYFLPVLIGRPRMEPFWLALVALSLNLAAFVADVVRASVESFPKGLREAAEACGLSKLIMYRRIIIPHVVRELLPTLSLLYIAIFKLSSLASVISVRELLHTADRIRSQTFQVLEVFSVVAAMYLLVVMPLSALVRRMENSTYFRRRS